MIPTYLLFAFAIAVCHHRTEALLVLGGRNERADHRVLDTHIAGWKTVHLAQPEEETTNVCVSSQVTKVLSRNKRAVIFRVDERAVVDGIRLRVVVRQPVQHCAATAGVEEIDEPVAL